MVSVSVEQENFSPERGNMLSVAMCRAPAGPLGIRLSELRLQSMQRLVARVLAAQKPSNKSVSRQSVPSDLPPTGLAAPIVLQNLCGMDLDIGQTGTAECVTIADGKSMLYR